MAFWSSRDSNKLNIIIFLLLLELGVFMIYIWNNGDKTREYPQNEKSKASFDTLLYMNRESVKDNHQNGFHAPLFQLNIPDIPSPPQDGDNTVSQINQKKPSQPREEQNPTSPQQRDCGPLPTDQEMKTLSHQNLSQLYHSYVNTVQMQCLNTVRHGHVGDGGWDVCLDPPYNISAPCTVYSFGIKNDWSFDDSITANYSCQLHAYDPSLTVGDYDRKPNLHFHKTGLGSSDENNQMRWRMRTFSTMLKENGHSEATIDILKMDIEGSEWEAFPQMLTSGVLNKVRQMCFEVHVRMGSEPEPNRDKYIRGIKLFKDLYWAGFRIFKTHKNMDARFHSRYSILRTGCHEIYMVNTHVKSIGCE